MKKGDISGEIQSAAAAVEALGGRLNRIVDVRLDELPDARTLIVIEKTRSTPSEYPRRSGLPAKKPLR
jgi:16S rRNA (guanine527-N7)-methyltransferase